MHPVIAKTFGGLSAHYYIRNFLFGTVFSAIYLMVLIINDTGLPMAGLAFMLINTFLYPYSRYVYEGTVDYILGNNVIFSGLFLMLVIKCITIILCWFLAIFIAPLGLAYLYYHHSKEV